jgi:ankyrin repeat protein
MDALLRAILDDNRRTVEDLLTADSSLVAARFSEARYYDEKIFHWLYVGDTALHLAAAGYISGPAYDPERQVKTIELLLAAGADVNAQDKNGAAPLHRAVRTRCAAAVRFLLKAGANPTLRNKPGSTAFHLAVQNTGRGGSGTHKARAAQREIIEEFLRFGVSPAIKDCNGKSVLDWVRSGWIREMFGGKAP